MSTTNPKKRDAEQAALSASQADQKRVSAPALAASDKSQDDDKSGDKQHIVKMPQKKFFRQRAHCNPLSFSDSFDYPTDPSHFDYASHFPVLSQKVRAWAISCALCQSIVFMFVCVCVCVGGH